MDGVFPGMALDAQELSGGAVIVHDGSALWSYVPKTNQYGLIPASALAEDSSLGDVAGELRPEVMSHLIIGRYRADTHVAETKFLR